MSLFQFLASDNPLDELDNPFKEVISINEALEKKIKIADFILNDTKINRNEKNILFFESEDYLGELKITNNTYYSIEYCKKYSKKQYFAELKFHYTKLRAEHLFKYIANQINAVIEIEVWNIWLNDDRLKTTKTVNINELKLTDLAFLDSVNGYNGPECLIIQK
ncbi:hypothetical protein Mevan_1411 [Methanococcus vannielii SB]|uniref:Uncharacterized protein n=1 Tax=Methanococcus vannielii (strain ATCC 35089 / DSM 1224 / JCM 13029 / OCM 148 / SB) TaxID=406327 RepID=A6US35_METVS|nr:hypothetical protein [Methanococcus vannielii]ABR55307.1 hypothetical protein Mevan_1411 [Methanococcus vannielii SB]